MKGIVKSKAEPKLRFQAFVKTGGWSTAVLRELATFVVDRAGVTNCIPYTVTSGVGLVSQVEKFGRTIAGNSLRNYIILERDDFAYNKSATRAFPEGYIARYMGKERAAVPNSIFTCFRVDARKVVPAYLDYLFASNLHGKWLRKFITIGARAHGSLNINDADLMAMPVPLPDGSTSLKEQQKIAGSLTSLDEVIAAQGRKVEAIKTYKRGLMQRLFPREGESLPRLRFPEFREGPEWKQRRFLDLLDDVIDFRGRTPKKLGLEWGGGEIVSLSANNVKNGFIDYDAECNLGSNELHSRWMEGVDLAKGDIVFTMEAPLGNALLVPDVRKYILSQRVVAFKTKPGVINEFLIQLIWSEGFQRAIGLLATGSTAKGISQKSLQRVHVSLPNEDEQRRIAQCLLPFDVRLSKESDKLHKLKEQKKSLMQQLFPSASEIDA